MNQARAHSTPFYRRRSLLTVLGVLTLAGILLAILFDWNWFKAPLQRIVEARTGREFRIDGDLDVDLGRIVGVRMDNVVFGNAAWARQPVMASADRAELDIQLWPMLFRHEVRIPEIRLDQPELRLETGPDGIGNWVFGRRGGQRPKLGALWVRAGRLQYVNERKNTGIDIVVESATTARPGVAPPILVKGSGRWGGQPFSLSGQGESPLALTESGAAYQVDLRASAGPTHAHGRGNLDFFSGLRVLDLDFTLSGQDLQDLYPLIGVAIPSSPPYRFRGRLLRERNVWHYRNFKGVVGDSDLNGTASVTVGRERPLLQADLVSQQLDFDDLAGFVGAAPSSGKSEAANARQRVQAAQQAASTRVLPTRPYDLTRLRAMDADVRWKAHRINAPKLPIDDMDAHLTLQAGLLRLQPLNFGVADGDIRSEIRMDARSDVIRTRTDIGVRGLNLRKLFPQIRLTHDAIGRIDGNIDVSGTGNSIAAMLGSADGEVALGMGRGRISNLLLELAGLDIAESLKFLLTKDRTVPVRCAFGDFAVSDGLMQARALAFDTSDTIIVGKGRISLKQETLDLELRPRPKDRSIFALRSPLVVEGTFKDPSFHPDFKRLGLRGATALVLGSITPPAALLATLELGPGKDSDCGGRYAK